MHEYNPCMGCEYYNKPYWSVVSPCKSCTKYHNMSSHTTNTTTNTNGLIVDDLVYDLNRFLSENRITFDKGGEFGTGIHLTGSIYDEHIIEGCKEVKVYEHIK